jgi:hypothetical protein
MYDICSPQLYKDCLVADLDTFLRDIETNSRKVEHLSKVSTLRVYHRTPRDYLGQKYGTYSALLSGTGDWVSCGMKKQLREPMAEVREAIEFDNVDMMDQVWLRSAAETLSTARNSHPDVMSNLVRAIMTGVGWKEGGDANECQAILKYTGWPMIPRLLLDLPSVQHYCQCLSTGPLGLDDEMYPLHPPKIFTFHPDRMLGLWDTGFCHAHPLSWAPSIDTCLTTIDR